MFALAAGVISVGAITGLLKGSVDEAREAQKVGAQTGAVIKSTGQIANVSAGQIGNLATSLSNKIGVDDEAIQAGENMLLTFTNVRNEVGKGNDIFARATTTVQDMAAAFGGDATSNSKILGKALNDPIRGVSALTRVGVTFTQGQKDQIKAMVDSGNTLGAQKIILRELGKETKGSAEAQATAGDKASVALGNLKETIGTALLPVIDRLATFFTTKIAPALTTFIGQLQSGEGAGGKVAAVFSTMGSVLGTVFGFIGENKTVTAVFVGSIVAMTVATAAFNLVMAANPISLVVIAIAALAAGLVYAYKNSETFRNIVDATFSVIKAGFNGIKRIVSAVIGFIRDHWRLMLSILGGPIGLAVALITKHWDKIKAGAAIVLGWIKDKWPPIKAIVTAPFEAAKAVIGTVWTALRQGAARVKEVVVKVFEAIQGAIQGAIDKAETLLEKLHLISKEKGSAVKGNKRASIKLTQDLKDMLATTKDTLQSSIDGFQSTFDSLVSSVSSAFTGDLFGAKTASSFIASLTKTQGSLGGLMTAFHTLQGWGLSSSFLSQLFASGNGGLIMSLAAGGQDTALAAGGLFGSVTDLSGQLGTAVAKNDDVGVKLDATNALLTTLVGLTGQAAVDFANTINGTAAKGHRHKKHPGGRK